MRSWRMAVLFLVFVCCARLGAQAPEALHLSGAFAGAHDPSIIQAGGAWYVFATGKAPGGGQIPIRCSQDLKEWQRCGQVFDAVPSWIRERSPGTKDLWAPDISYEHGVYRLYYAYSLFGKNTSGIALATNKTLDARSPAYRWVDEGLVLESVAADDFNAIDPNYIEGDSQHAWLAFGSFWSGIKMRALDSATGKLSAVDTKLYSLASRDSANRLPAQPGLPPDSQAVEAPFLFAHGGYYYLFVSFDLCCRGLKSTYHTVVGRSRSVTGPFMDREGRPMMQGGGTRVLDANAIWLGPGGESLVHQAQGPDLIAFHAYDARDGHPALQLSTVVWREGWPQAALDNESSAPQP